jgi:Family of unknown function (DUF6496)
MAWKSILSSKKAQNKIKRVLREHKAGRLRSGSKNGPKVKSRQQALAIAVSEAKKAVGAKS